VVSAVLERFAAFAPGVTVKLFVEFAIVDPVGSAAFVKLKAPVVVVAAPAAAAAAAESTGFAIVGVIVTAASLFAGVPVVVAVNAKLTEPPTATDAVAVAGALIVNAVIPIAAFAGATDKSPNPSEATATTATFFNEIVFTIFLSFSQIKDDLLSGW